jgi:transcriptional regulator GlxA family with amidase domain
LKSKLYELVHLIYASKQNQYLQSARFSEPTFETIKKAASFLDDNFAQEVSLASLAAKANLSPIYFHKMFKRYLGKTPHQYLLEKRLAAAESLLISTNLPLAEIALKSGFSSQAYFNYSFKQKTQLTPLQFRQRQASQYQL